MEPFVHVDLTPPYSPGDHYRLDAFDRKPDPPAQEGQNVDRRQPKQTTAEKRLFDEIERTYGEISVNMGAIWQIETKKMKK